jgi:hypothetical protein
VSGQKLAECVHLIVVKRGQYPPPRQSRQERPLRSGAFFHLEAGKGFDRDRTRETNDELALDGRDVTEAVLPCLEGELHLHTVTVERERSRNPTESQIGIEPDQDERGRQQREDRLASRDRNCDHERAPDDRQQADHKEDEEPHDPVQARAVP